MVEDSERLLTCMGALTAVSQGKRLDDHYAVDAHRGLSVREGLEVGLELSGNIVDVDNQTIVAAALRAAGAARRSWAISACCVTLIRALKRRDRREA